MLNTTFRIVATCREEGREIRLGNSRGRGELNQTKKQNEAKMARLTRAGGWYIKVYVILYTFLNASKPK